MASNNNLQGLGHVNVNKHQISSPKAFKNKSGGGSFCCVPGCSNQAGKDRLNGVKRSYYRFPKDTKQYKLWLNAIRRDKWECKSWHRICSDHFKGGEKSQEETHPSFVPSIFPFQKQNTPRLSVNSSKPVTSPLKESNPSPLPRKRKPSRKLEYFESPKPEKIVTPHISGHDYIAIDKENCEGLDKYLPEIVEKIQNLESALAESESNSHKILSLDGIKDDNEQMQFWTGFPNFETFIGVFEFFKPRAQQMQYWRGNATQQSEHYSKTFSSKPGAERKLSLIQEFFITMVRLRVGLLTQDLAMRFQISKGTLSSIFTSWINLMYTDLKFLCELPSNEVTTQNQSPAIGGFSDVRVILDCTELFVQNPSKLDARKQVFSNYKHHNTYKFLVGISPQMGITYVSKMYGGRASDRHITSDSADLLQNLETEKGSVMTDRGFLIEGILNDMGVKLHMPTFKGAERPQLTAKEAATSENISKVRIHIERAIQRIKTYHILDGELKLSMKNIAEQIFTVCAYLVNFQTPIVKT